MSAPEPAKLPPHAPEAERALLGCILLDPVPCLIECLEKFRGDNPFYVLNHRQLYAALLEMHEDAKHIDLLTLAQHLEDTGQLARIGGREVLASIQEASASATLCGHYLAIVAEKRRLRRYIETATRITAAAMSEPDRVEEFLDQAQADILNLDRDHGRAVWDAKTLVLKCADAIEHSIKAVGLVEMPTGFSYFDRLMGGVHPKEVFVLAGRPSTGKTSLATNMAERMAIEGHKGVAIISLEMTAQDLMMRMLCSRARVNLHKLRTGFKKNDDVEKLQRAGLKLGGAARIFIDDTPRMTVMQIRARLRQLKAAHDIRIAFIDYLQLIQSPRGLEENRVLALAEISAALKATAVELNISLVVLSQLSRESEKRGGRPRMSDLRDSGAIEQDADAIGILYREPLSDDEEDALREQLRDDPHAETEIKVIMEVCKNRNGPTGDVFFNFLRWCMRFEDLQRPSKPDEP